MEPGIKRITLSTDHWLVEDIDPYQINTDVIVELTNDEKYIASFFAYKNIEILARKNKSNKAFLRGKYFWTKNMILIECCTLETITEVIEEMMEEGEFFLAFFRL